MGILLWEERNDAHSNCLYMKTKNTSTPYFLTKGENTNWGLTITEYAFTSPFPMQIPHILSSDIQELLCRWATLSTGVSSSANLGSLGRTFFPGPISQYTSKESLTIKATLHVLPRPNWQRYFHRSHLMPRHWTLRCYVLSEQNHQSCPNQCYQGKIFQEASIHLRKCLS